MIKFENTVTPSPEQWKSLILGARNAMNSWEKSDSGACMDTLACHSCEKNRKTECNVTVKPGEFIIGPNDLSLMMKLRNSGTDHRKFMRMIVVYVDILAPLYWWKEFDTYKVGTVVNSCSTMHTIHKKEFTLDDFSCEHLDWTDAPEECYEAGDILDLIVKQLNVARSRYNVATERLRISTLTDSEREHILAQKKRFWYSMIQLLPSSYNQKRTVMLNYEVLANIYESRRGHKLDEWLEFRKWIFTDLPYSELITGCTESISG